MTFSGISVERTKELRRTMLELKIFEKDIEEHFIRSSGPGGQNVNKVATCVVLTHLPTGTKVKTQKERTQGLNRYWARVLLIDKIRKQKEERQRRIISEKQKKKRQNRKRSRAAKEKMLEGKRRRSEKKESRRKIRSQISGDL